VNVLNKLAASVKHSQKWLAAAIVITLLTTYMTGIAYAAEDKITEIEFNYDSSDYNDNTSSLVLFVEDEKINLTLLATISGSSSKKDVTGEATWKSSNTSYVKVDKGILTGVGKGTATISATYKGITTSIRATSNYVYDSITLMDNHSTAPSKVEVELGDKIKYTLNGSKNGTVEDVSSEAKWTTSSAAVATVDEGQITLVSTGTTTITAKLKGKTASITLVVSSPFKSISITPNKLIELDIGADDQPLQAIAVPKTGGSLDVTSIAKWSSENSKIATVENGVVTPVSAGKTNIVVSHLGVTTKIEVVVRTVYQSIKLTPEKEYHMLLQDQPLQVQADVLNISNVSYNATDLADWTSSNVVVATVSNGLITPKAVGTTKITASYKGVSRSIDITVYPSIKGITLDKNETLDGYTGVSGEFPEVKAILFDGSKTDVSKLVEWSSKDEAIVSIKDGKWVANELGETILIGKARNYEVQVKVIVHVKPLKLVADVKELSVILGKDAPYPSVIVVNEDGEEENVSDAVKWKASNENLVLKADSMKGFEVSTVTLTATYLNKSTTVKVRIEEEIMKLVADPLFLELNPNRTKSIKVTGFYKDGKSIVLNSKVNWTISSPSIVSINGSTIKALSPGKAIVTASYQDKKVTIPITVTPKLKSLKLSEKSTTLAPGANFTVSLTATYTTGAPVEVTSAAEWSTNKASVATVNNGKITAIGKGSATIRANFEGKSITFRVIVK